jgi:hypothetical protein
MNWPQRFNSETCLFSLFIRRIQAGDVAVKIGQIMLLPAIRIDDGARLHEAIQ